MLDDIKTWASYASSFFTGWSWDEWRTAALSTVVLGLVGAVWFMNTDRYTTWKNSRAARKAREQEALGRLNVHMNLAVEDLVKKELISRSQAEQAYADLKRGKFPFKRVINRDFEVVPVTHSIGLHVLQASHLVWNTVRSAPTRISFNRWRRAPKNNLEDILKTVKRAS